MRYIYSILLIFIGLTVSAQLPLKTFEKATAPNMFIGVDATDSLAQWKPLSGIGYSPLADSSKWTISGTNLFPKSLSYNVGIGLNNPAQQLELTGSFRTPATTSSTTGVWYKGTTPFAHNFKHPTGGGAIPIGRNTFIGLDAGNFTMGSTATLTAHASNNVAIGYQNLYNNTVGYRNQALGNQALYNNNTGAENSAFGYQSLYTNTSGYSNLGFGNYTLYKITTGYQNAAIGISSMYENTTGNSNVAIGYNSLYGNTTGNYNVSIGFNAGRYITGGSVANTTSDYSIYIGRSTKASVDNAQKEIVIGDEAIGKGSNTITLGGSTNTKTYFPYGGVNMAGISSTSDTTAVMINSSGDLSKRTLNAAAFNGTIDSTQLTPGYGIDVSEVSNNWTVKADTSEITTPYGVSQMISDSLALLTFNDTQDLSIDSTGRKFTISLTDGGSVSFLDTDTDTNTTYSAGFGLGLTGTTFSNARYWGGQDTLKTTLSGLVKATSGVLTAVTDNSSNWNTAYGWGNHASAGYLTSFTETDPIFGAHTAKNIANGSGFLKNNGIGTWTYDNSTYLTSEIDGSVTNEIQNLSYTASTRVLAIDGTGSTDATLPTFATNSTNAGLVNGSNSATSNFLRGDNTWQAVDISNTNEIELPTQTGNNGKYLTTNGTAPSWATISALTGSGAANRMAYFTGTSTLKGSTLITNDSTATTSMLNIMHSSGSGINGLRLFTTNSTPAGTNLRWQLANISGNLVFNGANTSSIFKVQNSAGTDKFILDPNNNKIGVYTPSGIDYGNVDGGGTTKYLGYDNANNRVAWLVPTVDLPSTAERYYNGTEQTISNETYSNINIGSAVIDNAYVTNPSSNMLQFEYDGNYMINITFNIRGGQNNQGKAYFKIIHTNSSNEANNIERIHYYEANQEYQTVTISTIMTHANKSDIFFRGATVSGKTFKIDNLDISITKVN